MRIVDRFRVGKKHVSCIELSEDGSSCDLRRTSTTAASENYSRTNPHHPSDFVEQHHVFVGASVVGDGVEM